MPFVGTCKHGEGEVQEPFSENQQDKQIDLQQLYQIVGQIVQCGVNISLLSEASHSHRALEDAMSPSSSTTVDRTANFAKTKE